MGSAAEPEALVNGLVEFGGHLRQNQIVHLMKLGTAPYVPPDMAAGFRHDAFFIGENVRDAVQETRGLLLAHARNRKYVLPAPIEAQAVAVAGK